MTRIFYVALLQYYKNNVYLHYRNSRYGNMYYDKIN